MDGNLAMANVLENDNEPNEIIINLLELKSKLIEEKRLQAEQYKKYEKQKDNPKMRVMQMFHFGKFQAIGNVLKIIDIEIDSSNCA